MKKIAVFFVCLVVFTGFASTKANAFLIPFWDDDGYVYVFSAFGGEGGFLALHGTDGHCPVTGTAWINGTTLVVGGHASGFEIVDEVLEYADYDFRALVDMATLQGPMTWWNTCFEFGGTTTLHFGIPPTTVEKTVNRTRR